MVPGSERPNECSSIGHGCVRDGESQCHPVHVMQGSQSHQDTQEYAQAHPWYARHRAHDRDRDEGHEGLEVPRADALRAASRRMKSIHHASASPPMIQLTKDRPRVPIPARMYATIVSAASGTPNPSTTFASTYMRKFGNERPSRPQRSRRGLHKYYF